MLGLQLARQKYSKDFAQEELVLCLLRSLINYLWLILGVMDGMDMSYVLGKTKLLAKTLLFRVKLEDKRDQFLWQWEEISQLILLCAKWDYIPNKLDLLLEMKVEE